MTPLEKWIKDNQIQNEFHTPFFLNFAEKIKKGDSLKMPATYSVGFYNSNSYMLMTLSKPISKIVRNKT